MIKNPFYKGTIDNSILPESNSRNDIVLWLYKTHLVEYYVTYGLQKPINDPDVEDYIQEIYEQVLMIPQEKLNELYEAGIIFLKGYLCRLIKNNNKSVNSIAYRNIKKKTKDWINFDKFDEFSSKEELLNIFNDDIESSEI